VLTKKKLHDDYWVEAVACSIYILNRSRSIKDKVPQEDWSGTEFSVSHFRVFGCITYAHETKELRKKLDHRSEKCICTRYNEQQKAYRLYNPITKKVVGAGMLSF